MDKVTINRPNRIGFYFDDNDNKYDQNVRLMYEVSPDMHISELHDLCRRFALALGYQQASVDEYFGACRIDEAF